MRSLAMLFALCFFHIAATAQWSNTGNLFTDSAQMPVCTELRTQDHAMAIKSYPDGGYIVFWDDMRNSSSQGDIYAQKYDKTGKALWAVNGVPVATGNNNQHLYSAMNADYRNYSYAATDSAGGFYIVYMDDSISTYAWYRICVQHIRKNGLPVFKGPGFVAAATAAGGGYNYASPQLVADGNKGFFVSYLYLGGGAQDLYVNCYRDEAGTMKYYGGGQMDINAYEQPSGSCSNNIIAYRDAYVSDYMIYPDLQKGCNVVMTLSQNAGGNDRMFTGYNRVVRVKKQSKVTTGTSLGVLNYTKDSVLIFYRVIFHTYTFQCGSATGTGYILDGNGYLQINDLTYNQEYAKGVAVATGGNINANIIAFSERKYLNNVVTNWFTHAYYRCDEIHDSIPYPFTVYPFQPQSYVGGPKPGQNKFGNGADTILNNNSVYDFDFCLSAGANKIFATSLMYNSAFIKEVLLQQLQVKQITADSFAIKFATANKNGVKLGSEITTGFGGANIAYNSPQVAMDDKGNALFYIREYGRQVRVSPILNNGQLAWGAMGRLIGSGTFGTTGYNYPDNPFVTLGPVNGTGVICWRDSKNIPPNSAENISMRHLDSLNKAASVPPYKPVKLLSLTGGQANPLYLAGSSKRFSLVEYLNVNYVLGGFADASPAVEILDKYLLGALSVNIYQNNGAIRVYNSKPYLSRNFTIQPQFNPKPGNTISMRLFFTSDEFNALKAANASVKTPADLAVIKQPYTVANAPSTYTPVTGEQKIAVQAWAAVAGGYYIQLAVTGFTGYNNYFIFPSAIIGPPAAPVFTALSDALNTGKKTFIETIYPTVTAEGVLNIKTGNESVKQMLVEVYAVDGKIYYKKLLSYQPQQLRLSLPAAVYEIRITSGTLSYSGTLIKH